MQLNPVLEAARELEIFLRGEGGAFCFIGGLAIQRWGEPRFTNDTDASLLTRFVEDEKWIDLLLSRFEPRLAGAREFALSRRVLLLRATAALVSTFRWRGSSSRPAALDGHPLGNYPMGRPSRHVARRTSSCIKPSHRATATGWTWIRS